MKTTVLRADQRCGWISSVILSGLFWMLPDQMSGATRSWDGGGETRGRHSQLRARRKLTARFERAEFF